MHMKIALKIEFFAEFSHSSDIYEHWGSKKGFVD